MPGNNVNGPFTLGFFDPDVMGALRLLRHCSPPGYIFTPAPFGGYLPKGMKDAFGAIHFSKGPVTKVSNIGPCTGDIRRCTFTGPFLVATSIKSPTLAPDIDLNKDLSFFCKSSICFKGHSKR
jgi:hypothetical protein